MPGNLAARSGGLTQYLVEEFAKGTISFRRHKIKFNFLDAKLGERLITQVSISQLLPFLAGDNHGNFSKRAVFFSVGHHQRKAL
jgi:hypothetical protein